MTLLLSVANFRNQGVFIWKLAGLQFRVDHFAIDGQLEAATAGRLQFHARDFLFVATENLFRQTDGSRLVVSSRAVAQVDLHRTYPSIQWKLPRRHSPWPRCGSIRTPSATAGQAVDIGALIVTLRWEHGV